MKRIRVAIQGERGSFSEEAAVKMLGERAQTIHCPAFSVVFETLRRKRADCAVLPIENTLAGPVYENYDLLLEHGFWVEAEFNLRIEHMLIAPRGIGLKAIREVHSHPVALAQCRKFFARHKGIRAVAAYDTAGAVRTLVEHARRDAAAIAGRAAAAAYGARILARNLEDDRGNFTRFLLVRPTQRTRSNANKTSIVFATHNIPGSLFRCLAVFALRDVSLTKIESRPWPGRPWEYRFYVDFIGRPDTKPGQQALAHLSELTSFLRVLGCYPNSRPQS
jgi:prephenate dehydratase